MVCGLYNSVHERFHLRYNINECKIIEINNMYKIKPIKVEHGKICKERLS